MAKLKDIAESLNVSLEKAKDDVCKRSVGRKRRAWLIDEELVQKPVNDYKGHIYPIHKGHICPIKEGAYMPLMISLENLRGNPLKIAQYIFELSKETKDKIIRLTQTDIIKGLSMQKYCARAAIRFLMEHELLERISLKIGKGGYSNYKLKNSLFEQFEVAPHKGHIACVSSSSYTTTLINTTTTPYTRAYMPLWQSIDVSPLHELGFNKKHILQLKTKNTPEIIQDSINHFAYGLKFNKKTKSYTDPISTLMGVLRKGEAWVESNYKSAQEIAQQELIKRKKVEAERLKKQEEKIYEQAFSEWFKSLTSDAIVTIASNKTEPYAVPQRIQLNTYFQEKVWPTKKERL